MPFIYAVAILIGYYALSAGGIAIFSKFFPKLKEISRKAYHMMACLSVFILVFAFNHWYLAVLAVGMLASLVFIVLPLANLIPKLKSLSIGRKGKFNEVLKQAGFFFLTISLLIGLIWGIFGSDYKVHIIVGLTVLGVGDAAAALFGKRYGKRKLKFSFFDTNKTIEGSLAMVVTAFVGVLAVLLLFTEISFWYALVSSLILALLGTLVEAASISGIDTIAIPMVTSFASIGLALLGILINK